MSRVETQQLKYIVGEKFQEQKRASEKRLKDYKARLVEIADKIGYDAMRL